LLTRYEDVQRLLRDPRLGSQTLEGLDERLPGLEPRQRSALSRFYGTWLSLSDGPAHEGLRRSIAPLLAPARVAPWTPALADRAAALAPAADPARIEATFARPYAAAVVGAVLGLTAPETADALLATAGLVRVLAAPRVSTEHAAAAVAALATAGDLARLAAGRAPGPGPVPLLHGSDLPEDVLVAVFVQLLAGGYDPLARCITACAQALVADAPDRADGLRGFERARVDDLIRLHGPFELVPRIVTEPVQLGDRTLEPGQRVLLAIGSANRDESRFPDPAAVRTDRPTHLAFGSGRHRCPAAGLASAAVAAALAVLPRP
jgi:cytochrome P450